MGGSTFPLCHLSGHAYLTCPHCNGIGKGDEFAYPGENQHLDKLCAVCRGYMEVEKRQSKPEWVLVQNSDDLVQVWLNFLAKRHFGDYDSFEIPLEYPCLVRVHTEQIADGGGTVMDFFYPSDVPDAWKSNNRKEEVSNVT